MGAGRGGGDARHTDEQDRWGAATRSKTAPAEYCHPENCHHLMLSDRHDRVDLHVRPLCVRLCRLYPKRTGSWRTLFEAPVPARGTSLLFPSETPRNVDKPRAVNELGEKNAISSLLLREQQGGHPGKRGLLLPCRARYCVAGEPRRRE